jgi:1-acyl-sn-glycerol-3-phosphate acyltransferase|tara:strand:- start:1014 stop:1610 length:597 start_codon:yes stop_codon:yes gene_type:complete
LSLFIKTIVPDIHLANRPKIVQWFGRTLQKVSGWKVEGEIPNLKKFILVGAPHTSNWDFVHALILIWAVDLKLNVLAKHTLFEIPFLKNILSGIGGIPVDRKNPQLVVDEVSKLTEKDGGVIIGLTPEGTRKRVEKWKSGFLRIAQQTDCKIVLIGIDFDKKICSFSGFFEPTGDNDQDIKTIKNFYKDFKPKIPNNF